MATRALIRWGLRTRVAVVAALGMVVAIVAVAGANRWLAGERLLRAEQARAHAIGEGLAVQLQRLLALGLRIDEVHGFEDQCDEALRAHAGLSYALALGTDGGLLFGATPQHDARTLAGELHRAISAGGLRPSPLADRSHAVAVPVHDLGGTELARIVVGFPQSVIDEADAEVLRATAIVGGATLALGLPLLWLLLSRLVTRPLSTFVAAMNDIDSAREGVHRASGAIALRDPDLASIDESFRRLLQRIADREADLVQARDAAEQASRMKSEFLAVMSHELRTPLNAVLGMAQLLEHEPLPPRQQQWVGHIRQGGETLLAIVNDVLDLASIEAGRLQLVHEPFDLHALLWSVAGLHSATTQLKGLALRTQFAPGLPPCVRGDRKRLAQVLNNLLANATKFTAAGEVALVVAPAPPGLRFEVVDTGPGIAPEFMPHLYQAFRQADTTVTRRHGGTGLGLAIVRRLVDAMGGRIDVRSALGAGTTFTVELPLEPCTADEAAVLARLAA